MSTCYLAIIEILIGVWKASKLSGAAIQVDVAGAKDGQKTHLRLPRASWRENDTH